MTICARAAFWAPLALGACLSMCAVLIGCASANSNAAGDAPRADEAGSGGPGSLGALREAALASRGAADVVRSLTDEVGPRLAGSKGDRAAVEWAVRTLTARGFSNVHTEVVTAPHWERGLESGAVVLPAWQPLSLTALGGSVGTPPSGGIEAEVVEVDSLDGLDKLAKDAAKGRIVFFNSVMNRARDGSGYGKAVSVRSLGAVRAAKLGAVGVVIRSIGTGNDRFPHTGAMRRDQGTPSIPAAALSIPDAELLHRLLAQHKSVRLQLKLGCRWLGDVESANVIGEIPGGERPDEIVLIGAHLDSWDLGTGAVDDGAGVGIAVEAGRQIASLRRPRRTIRVALFANEENGLSGARQYAQAHLDELPRHVLAMEADAGTGRAYAVRFLGAVQDRPRVAQLVTEVKPLGLEMVDSDAHGGADLSPMRPAGVPIMDVAQDMSTYFDIHHTANDTFDKIDPEALAQVSSAVAVIAYAFANLEGEIGRVPEEKRTPDPRLQRMLPDDHPRSALP